MLFGVEFFIYFLLREDVNVFMIVWVIMGEMGFELLIGIVLVDFKLKIVIFVFLSDIDFNQWYLFDVYFNGIWLLIFQVNEDGMFRVFESFDQVQAEFFLICWDVNGDGFGLFWLMVLAGLLVKGEKVCFCFVGYCKYVNVWFMIFKVDDVVECLCWFVESEVAFDIREWDGQFFVGVFVYFVGQFVYLVSDGKWSVIWIFEFKGELFGIVFVIKLFQCSFFIRCGDIEIVLRFENKDGILIVIDFKGDFIYYYMIYYQQGWRVILAKFYCLEFFEVYSDFFDCKYEKGQVFLMNFSYQDIVWVDCLEVCIILWDMLLLMFVFWDVFVWEDYGFDIEDGLMLCEYFECYLEFQEKLIIFLNWKLIFVGVIYNCFYEDMYDVEDQVWQFYFGKKWVKKIFGGYDFKVYWNVDVLGKFL